MDENDQFYISLIQVPKDMYVQKVTARAYVKNGEEVTYGTGVAIRSLIQVTLNALNSGEEGANLTTVKYYVTTNYMKAYNDFFGNFNIDSSIYGTNPVEVGELFIKDYNNVMETSVTISNFAA